MKDNTYKESRFRSFIKGITWRGVGTLDTLVISYFVIKEGGTATGIAIWDTVLKLILYYGHERLWQHIPLGTIRANKRLKAISTRLFPKDALEFAKKKESHIRSILKGISWRIVGTFTTILVAYVITGNTTHALAIGGIEVVTKFILYYIHERAWQLVPRGTFKRLLNRE